ncbi:hypothetical protein D3C75_736490 [compost metagenome]
MHVADFTNRLTSDLFDINPGAGGDFTANQNHAGFNVSLASYACFWILLQDRIEDRIGDLVSDFIGMPF